MLTERFQIADPQRLPFALTLAVEAADALIKLAFRRPGGDEQILGEAAGQEYRSAIEESAALS